MQIKWLDQVCVVACAPDNLIKALDSLNMKIHILTCMLVHKFSEGLV